MAKSAKQQNLFRLDSRPRKRHSRCFYRNRDVLIRLVDNGGHFARGRHRFER
jgi:hypothetical protein